jgi:hypothetical protein
MRVPAIIYKRLAPRRRSLLLPGGERLSIARVRGERSLDEAVTPHPRLRRDLSLKER